MFSDRLLQGRRILVTGGGTGLGKGMAENFSRSAPMFSSAGAGSPCARRPPLN
jgi:NADP-dependent 3-hydroxy acid dehydrogenase YdfG